MNPLARIPAVDRLLSDPRAAAWIAAHGRAVIADCVRQALAEARAMIRAGAPVLEEAALWGKIEEKVVAATSPRLRPVFNLTGTVLHTNLGRAPLPEEAIVALTTAARQPCALEYDLARGMRGDRDDIIEDLLVGITGAEAATVVNNNAAAVFLLLNTLAQRKEVVVSRGELVEIGGSFRIPEIMRRAGAKLVEVGTTNRTHRHDFAAAIGAKTALIMKVHTSNYAIVGFTHAVPERELAELAHEKGIPFVVDLGSGTLVDLEPWGLAHEPTPQESLSAGADLVSFSADKLLGGPQAGLLVGRRELIAKIKKNPLKRALRVGKLTLAALEAVLRLYQNPDRLADRLTTLRLLVRTQGEIEGRARHLLPFVRAALAAWPVTIEVTSLFSQIGSGALPIERLPSAGLAIRPTGKARAPLLRLEKALHALPTPVIGRIEAQTMLWDLRCLEERDEAPFLANLRTLS
ncbi:MAG: L-seryl-tRNA(Sec) selenium transferase [Rhodocyclaceae bacterium]|nr:L-seryl-tRNA(Sec) selenium transferase [Rhodocyclaceae bacterium]